MRHQRTDLPPSKSKWKQYSHRSKSKHSCSSEHENQRPPLGSLIQAKNTKEEIIDQGVVTPGMLKVSSVLPGSSSARPVTNMVILPACAIKSNHPLSQETPSTPVTSRSSIYAEDFMCGKSNDLTSSNVSFCLEVKIQYTQANAKFPTPHHLITNLAYRLKPHHKRNQYLRTRLDTCAM